MGSTKNQYDSWQSYDRKSFVIKKKKGLNNNRSISIIFRQNDKRQVKTHAKPYKSTQVQLQMFYIPVKELMIYNIS